MKAKWGYAIIYYANGGTGKEIRQDENEGVAKSQKFCDFVAPS